MALSGLRNLIGYLEERLLGEDIQDANDSGQSEASPLLHREDASISNSLSDFQADQILIDVTVKCGNHEFPAHKAYLADQSVWFRNRFKTSNDDVVEVDYDDPDTILRLLKYIYLEQLDFSKGTFELLAASEYLNMAHISKLCRDQLLATLVPSTLIEVWDALDKYEKKSGVVELVERVVDQFPVFLRDPTFASLSKTRFKQVMSKATLKCEKMCVLRAFCLWLEKRSALGERLTNNICEGLIDFSKIPRASLVEAVEHETVFKNSAELLRQVTVEMCRKSWTRSEVIVVAKEHEGSEMEMHVYDLDDRKLVTINKVQLAGRFRCAFSAGHFVGIMSDGEILMVNLETLSENRIEFRHDFQLPVFALSVGKFLYVFEKDRPKFFVLDLDESFSRVIKTQRKTPGLSMKSCSCIAFQDILYLINWNLNVYKYSDGKFELKYNNHESHVSEDTDVWQVHSAWLNDRLYVLRCLNKKRLWLMQLQFPFVRQPASPIVELRSDHLDTEFDIVGFSAFRVPDGVYLVMIFRNGSFRKYYVDKLGKSGISETIPYLRLEEKLYSHVTSEAGNVYNKRLNSRLRYTNMPIDKQPGWKVNLDKADVCLHAKMHCTV